MKIAGELKSGIIMNFIAKYSNIIIQFVILSVLARLLTPQEFGIVALVSIFINFFTLLGDMGIGPAIIQNKELEERDLTSIFNFTFVLGVAVAVLFAFSGYGISYFYNNEVYTKICLLLSLVVLLSILNIVPTNLLLKNKQFLKLGFYQVISNSIAGFVAIFMAYNDFSYYALIIQSIISSAILFLLIVKSSGLILKLYFNLASVKKIFSFSSYQFGFNFVNFFARNLDKILIGKLMGEAALAFYDKAYRLVLYPVQNISFVITPVLHPVLSNYQSDIQVIYKVYIKLFKVLSIIGVFISVYCYFTAEELINLAFGNQWNDSIDTFKILSITIVLQMIGACSGAIFQSTGNVKILFLAGIITSFNIVTAIIIGAVYGAIEHVAIGYLIAATINFVIVSYLFSKYVFKIKLYMLLKELKYMMIIGGIITVFLYVNPLLTEIMFVNLIINLLIALLGLLLGLFITGQHQLFKILLKSKSNPN